MPTLAGLVALVFAAIHLFSGRLLHLREIPRSAWLSAAGGVSVAYVFVHLLPELAEHQQSFERAEGWLGTLESHVWLAALAGLALFYGLERLAKSHRRQARDGDGTAAGTFWVHLGAFALYNFLIGYLLMRREDEEVWPLLTYGFAMGLHFVVNDHGLRADHGAAYDRLGRWILAAMPLLGWGIGLATELPPLVVPTLIALLGGSVVLNVMKEELPEERESRFSAFAAGAALYAGLLLLV